MLTHLRHFCEHQLTYRKNVDVTSNLQTRTPQTCHGLRFWFLRDAAAERRSHTQKKKKTTNKQAAESDVL